VTFVLVHGGGFSATCWDLLRPHLGGTSRAVDLPGRGSRPAELTRLTLADCVDAVVGEVEGAGLSEVVLVGHSLAGITLPGVLARIPERIRTAVFVSAAVPPDGGRVYDLLDPAVQEMAADASPEAGDRSAPPAVLDHDVARAIFCNDMDEDQTRFTLEAMVPEAPGLIFERVGHAGLRYGVPLVYVRLGRDQVLAPDLQDRMVRNLGGADVVGVDAGHMAMISRPRDLARVLNGR
jgi:pimeloyl-ACP methyl ester carboxylesterase